MMNLADDFRSPAFKRGVKDAKRNSQPREATPEYLKGYADEWGERPDAAPPKEVEPVVWRFRTIGRSGKRYNWLYYDELPKDDDWLPENPDHYELQPLYASFSGVALQMEEALELLHAAYLTATHHSGMKKNLKRAIISVQNAVRCKGNEE